MDAPQCPKPEVLKRLIKFNEDAAIRLPSGTEDSTNATETANALRYLENFLSNRRGYQRKNQIKRKMIWKLADEMGLMSEIDDAVAHRFGKETIDDVTDEEIEGHEDEEDNSTE